ncbi:MAG: hypothetical protein MJ103_04735 [Saccharofermentans sp.]|nr:hypothetical protein [Saccharofermentans sp.]
MESLKKTSLIMMIESIVAAVASLAVALFVICIAFISMFADNSFGFGEFFFYSGVVNSGVVINIILSILAGCSLKYWKNIIAGTSTIGRYEKRLKTFSIAQIVIDGIIMLIFFIVFISGLVKLLGGDGYQYVLVTCLLGGFEAVFSVVHLLQSIMTLTKLKSLYQ